MRARTDCAELVAQGSIRINRRPTEKPHAKLRVGDILTIPVRGAVRVLRVVSLAIRRGSATEACGLYIDISQDEAAASADISDVSATPCIAVNSSAYRGA
jgi:ribosome-associated heat shock protein Hsp15